MAEGNNETMDLKIYPDEILRGSCKPVREIARREAERMKRMLDFMYRCDGVGLAGPQGGWKEKVVTVGVGEEGDGPRIFVNPRITSSEGESEMEEGCLSLPGVRAEVKRAERITVVAYTLDGKRIEEEMEGLRARAWQHEVDHLHGMLFIDRLEPTQLVGLRRKLKELRRKAQEKESR